MSLRTISCSTEIAAENLLMEAREYDQTAFMYREHDDEGGFWTVCYRWDGGSDVSDMRGRDGRTI